MSDLIDFLVPKGDELLRLRQGVIASVQTTSATVTIGGSTTQIAGVKWFSGYSPVANDTVWLLEQDRQYFIIGSLSPGSGWTAYTPAFSAGVTLGNGLLEGRYIQIGKTVHCSVYFKAGTTTVFAAAQWQITLPVPVHGASDTTGTVGNVLAYNGTYWVCGADIEVSGGNPLFVPYANNTGGFTNLIPFTWANGHQMRLNVSYEAA